MDAALLILRKDLRLRLRDRSVLLFALVVPLGLTFLFSAILPPMDGALELRAVVVDDDGGDIAAGFVDELLPALVDEGLLVGVERVDRAVAERRLEDGDIDAAWVLPPSFSDDVAAGRGARMEVLVNPDRRLGAEVARSIAEGFAGRIDEVTLAVATTATAAQGQLGPAELEAIATEVAAGPPLVRVDELVASDQRLDATSYLAAGMAAFFVFFTVQFGVTGLLEERQQGTMPRLLAAPIAPSAVQVGKSLGAFLLGVVSLGVLATASALALDASWGPVPGVAVMVVALAFAATGLMALVGSFARTSEQAGNLQSIVAVSLGALGGVFFPVGEGFVGIVANISPHGWFLRGLGAQVASGDWTDVLPAAGAVLAFGVAAGVPAALRLRRSLRW